MQHTKLPQAAVVPLSNVSDIAETVGVSKSNLSREFIETGEQRMKEFTERRFDDRDILIIYIDGIRFGEFYVIAAVAPGSTKQGSFCRKN